MPSQALDQLPGFRRRFRITPAPQRVCSAVEDDFHCMEVTVEHDGNVATHIEARTVRAPWDTCPGAVEVLRKTFIGVPLRAFGRRGEKRANCTHLHDLATLAAAHALDAEPLVYDVLVSDPVDGRRRAELRRNGTCVLAWAEHEDRLTEPSALAGMSLFDMNGWIAQLDAAGQEAARILRWGTLIAHGRTIPLEQQSDASRMPLGNCYTFQPERRNAARRIGRIRDFSTEQSQPLDARGAA